MTLFFSSIFFFVRRRAKETINGGTYGLRRRTFVIITIFLPHRRVKTFSDDYSVLLLTFLPSVSKIWCHQDWQAILKQKGCYVIFEKEANNFNFRRKYKLTSAIRDGAKHVEAVKPFDLPLSGSTISTILKEKHKIVRHNIRRQLQRLEKKDESVRLSWP